MRLIIITLNIFIGIYFFVIANLLFWGSIIGYFAGLIVDPELLRTSLALIVNVLFAPFLMYAAIMFFRKNPSKYVYGMVLLALVMLETQIYRFFFVTNHKLEMTDFSNLLFYGVPLVIIILTYKFSKKCTSNSHNR